MRIKRMFMKLGLLCWLASGQNLFALDEDSIVRQLKQMKIEVTGPSKVLKDTLPLQLEGPQWGLDERIARDSGWDLAAYAGKDISYTMFPISERTVYGDEPLNVWVMAYNDKIVWIYKAVREGSSMAPGIYPVENPERIK